MVDLAMSIFEFLPKFWSFDTPDTPGYASAVIWNHYLKQIWVIPPTVICILPSDKVLTNQVGAKYWKAESKDSC